MWMHPESSETPSRQRHFEVGQMFPHLHCEHECTPDCFEARSCFAGCLQTLFISICHTARTAAEHQPDAASCSFSSKFNVGIWSGTRYFHTSFRCELHKQKQQCFDSLAAMICDQAASLSCLKTETKTNPHRLERRVQCILAASRPIKKTAKYPFNPDITSECCPTFFSDTVSESAPLIHLLHVKLFFFFSSVAKFLDLCDSALL